MLGEELLQYCSTALHVMKQNFNAAVSAFITVVGPIGTWSSSLVVLAVLFTVLGLRFLSVLRRLRSVGYFPGIRLVLAPEFPYPLPRIPYVCMDAEWWTKLRHQPFAEAGADVLTVEVFRSRATFIKPVEMYKLLNLVGVHIVSAEGADYRRHRMPAQGSFTERSNRLVWDTSIDLARRLLKSFVWAGKDVVEIDEAVDITLPYALKVINVAVFGRPDSDNTAHKISAGSIMPFEEAADMAMANLVTLVIIPEWIRSVRAADSETNPELRLTDMELVADVMAFLIGGHESTAHTIAIALGLLALHPEEQEMVYEELRTYSEPENHPVTREFDRYEDLNKLRRTLAVLHETLRLYPPVAHISKESTIDTNLPLAFPAPNGMTSVPVPKGTIVTAHIIGLHYNPRWWKDPFLFRPTRFLDPHWPRDAFLPFSAGPRVCIGRRFAETESIALLAVLISKYRIELSSHAKQKLEGVTDERERRELGIKIEQRLTLMPAELGLVFRKRTKVE
ncbi:614/534 cytochrome P450 [Auriculariales sp. MPI-PUGE-AT-0066]|nr:614/534 cytochrome P450 [Auriculariales sp. MPI-PUGE-AT-0066]